MILFDGHTHIYDCFDLSVFFEAACKNFTAEVNNYSESSYSCCLLLTEAAGYNYFKRIKECVDRDSGTIQSWQVTLTSETESLVVYHKNYPEMKLYVIAGRQVKTLEGLEVLALCTDSYFADGIPLEEVTEAIIQEGGIAVCPWGAGKWLGGRGKVLAEYVACKAPSSFFLGDSGGRPGFWSRPELLARADSSNGLLSGSDPLPLAGEEKRVASYGGYLQTELFSHKEPAKSFKTSFLEAKDQVRGFGSQMSFLPFLKSQLLLRIKK